MIFITVGTQLPFDRLIKAVDSWAVRHPELDFVIQSGGGEFKPSHCELREFISPSEWEGLFSEAELVVSHAGMGTIIKAMDSGKPLILMPRKASMQEHRNDHQIATVSQLKNVENIVVVENEDALHLALDAPPKMAEDALKQVNNNLSLLISEIRSFSLGAP